MANPQEPEQNAVMRASDLGASLSRHTPEPLNLPLSFTLRTPIRSCTLCPTPETFKPQLQPLGAQTTENTILRSLREPEPG